MKKLLFLLITLVLLCGCVTIDYTGWNMGYTSTVVKIFWEKPDFDYEILGRIQATGEFAEESMIFDKIIAKAQEVGAKAIIVLNTTKDDAYVPLDQSFMIVDKTHIWALAIWYENEEE